MNIEDTPAWADYLELRKAKNARAPFTPAARRRILLKLADMQAQGIDIEKALGESVENGWTSVYPPKAQPGHGAQSRSFRERDQDAAAQRVASFTGGMLSRRVVSEEDLFRDVPRLEQ